MKLWIDDIRRKPSDYDFWAKSYDEAIEILNTKKITHISFDHDLGSEQDNGMDTGYDIARVIEKWAHDGDIPPMTWDIHSSNPVGRRNIDQAMKSAKRFWTSNKYMDF